ncbi:MAG: alpha/beta hydrolase [Deltaproteobacteria bacterium]|nr:alpha/beta hydrolase [Deltaproteobacteria bacterium]
MGLLDVPGLGPREVRLCLPPGSGRRAAAPLLLLWDGQNVFDDEPSYAGGWQVHRLVARRAARGRVVPIVVGIHHGGADRLRELAPWAPRGRSLSEPLLQWVADALVPTLRAQFHVGEGPRAVTVGGSSLGGLMSLWGHFRRPDVFGNALVMSPSLFLGRGAVFRYLASQPRPWATRIYLDAGGREMGGRLVRLAARLETDLLARGWDGGDLMFRAPRTGEHSELHWRRRMPRAMEFLYG